VVLYKCSITLYYITPYPHGLKFVKKNNNHLNIIHNASARTHQWMQSLLS